MSTRRMFAGLAALTFLSAGALTGCAVEASPDDEVVEESSEQLSAAGKALIGSYRDDSGAFRRLVLTSTKVGQRNVFTADVDTGIRCIVAPCPSAEHIEGTFTAGSKTITLYSDTASAHAQHLLGRYNHLVQGAKFTLSRRGFTQSLERDAVIWPSSATKLVARVSGGFMPPPPAGSTCSNGGEYTLDAAAKKLSWKLCDWNGANPRHYKTGTTTLTAAEIRGIGGVLNGLEISTRNMCGADKPFQTFTVSTPAGDARYTDSFYGCRGGSDTYVDGIGSVFNALRDASGN